MGCLLRNWSSYWRKPCFRKGLAMAILYVLQMILLSSTWTLICDVRDLNIPICGLCIVMIVFFMRLKAPRLTFQEKMIRMDWGWGILIIVEGFMRWCTQRKHDHNWELCYMRSWSDMGWLCVLVGVSECACPVVPRYSGDCCIFCLWMPMGNGPNCELLQTNLQSYANCYLGSLSPSPGPYKRKRVSPRAKHKACSLTAIRRYMQNFCSTIIALAAVCELLQTVS